MALGRPISLTSNVGSKIIRVLATEGQTSFTVTGGYRINQIGVFRNGVRLSNNSDFTAIDGVTVTLVNAASLDDEVLFEIQDDFRVADAIVSAASTQTIYGDLAINGDFYYTGSSTGIVTTITAGDNISVNQSTGSVVITGLANTANVSADTLVVTGVSTLGQVEGISGISTTFVSAVGIQSGGTTIGTGITQINFIGAGNTFKVDGTTVDVSIESGGGGAGLSTTGISTGYIFSNPQLLNESADLTQPNHNYAVFGPVVIGVGVTINVGAGNTFVVV